MWLVHRHGYRKFHRTFIDYGEDILDKIKGCEFHYKQSVGKRVKQLGGDLGQEFEKYAYELLYATTPEVYEHAFGTLQSFIRSSATLSQQQDWLDWWSNRKQYIFRAFTSFDAPSNLSEVVHAGWKHRDRTGVSLLECCYFYIRDSLFTNVHLEELPGWPLVMENMEIMEKSWKFFWSWKKSWNSKNLPNSHGKVMEVFYKDFYNSYYLNCYL